MRCAVYFEEEKPLAEQEIKAWGEMQSLDEEPEYKESDIKSEYDKAFLHGYKCAFDDVCNILYCLKLEKVIKKKHRNAIELRMSGDLCMQLFSILDNQFCEEDDNE